MIYFDGIIESLQKSGGISVYFQEILQRLARDNKPFAVGTYGGGSILSKVSDGCASDRELTMLPRVLERFRSAPTPKNAKVFHSSYYRVPDNKVIPSVVTVHDFTYERIIGGFRSKAHSYQKFRAIKKSDTVICVSHSTKCDLLEFVEGIDPDKVHVVHNGVGDAFRVLNSLGEDKSKMQRPYVLYVGARGGYKNFALALKVLRQLPDYDFISVGGGRINDYENKLINYYLPNRFRHVGYVPDSALNKLYNGAEFLLYPSSYEGFGIPLLEAMKAGCPVVAVDASSIPEVGGPSAFLAENPTEESLITTIDKLLYNSAERKHRIELGLDWAQKFSWEKCYKETSDIYSIYH